MCFYAVFQFSPKNSLQYLIIHVKVGNVPLTWAFIPKDFSLTRRNYNYTRTLLYSSRSLWSFGCTLHFQRKNPSAACPDGMADGAGSLLLCFIAHCKRNFSLSHLPPPSEATEREFLRDGYVAEQCLPMPSPQSHGREGISTRISSEGQQDLLLHFQMCLWCWRIPGTQLLEVASSQDHPASQQILVPLAKKPPGFGVQNVHGFSPAVSWEPLHCQMEMSHCSACALSSKDTLSPLSWLWPALLCANINLGFSLAQPGSSQGETPLVWIIWQEFLMVGLENAAFLELDPELARATGVWTWQKPLLLWGRWKGVHGHQRAAFEMISFKNTRPCCWRRFP